MTTTNFEYSACSECYFTAPHHETGCPNWPDEPVKVTLPRSLVEHIGELLDIHHGAWSGAYKALAPFLLNPKADPSTPIPLENPAQKIASMENPKKHDTRSDWPRHLREVRSKG